MSKIQVCPHCGNHVEGKRIQSYSKKVAKTGVKSVVNGAASVGTAGTGAAIGSAILPGIGTAIGTGIGLIGSAMFHTAVNDGIDKAADIVTDAEYEFTCPKCGHTWTGKEDDEGNYDVPNIKRIIANTLMVDYDEVVPNISFEELGADDLDVAEICMKLESEFGIDIPDGTIDENSCVDDIIEYITGESMSEEDHDSSIADAEQEYLDEYPQLAQYLLNMFRKEYCQPHLSYDSTIDEAKTERALNKIAALFEDYPSIKKSIFFNWQHRKEHSRIFRPVDNIKDVVGFCVMVIVNTPERLQEDEKQLYFFNKYIVPYCRPNTQPSTPVNMAVPNVHQILGALEKDGITVDADSYEYCLEQKEFYENVFNWSSYILSDEKEQITYPETTTLATCKNNINRIVCGLIDVPIFVDVAVPDTTNPAEQEYLDNIREFLEDDAEITPRERKMLDRIRKKLGISEERAKELEASLTKPQLTEDEQEYLDMYHEYAEKGELTEKERRRLDKFAAAMGISAERVKEIEKV